MIQKLPIDVFKIIIKFTSIDFKSVSKHFDKIRKIYVPISLSFKEYGITEADQQLYQFFLIKLKTFNFKIDNLTFHKVIKNGIECLRCQVNNMLNIKDGYIPVGLNMQTSLKILKINTMYIPNYNSFVIENIPNLEELYIGNDKSRVNCPHVKNLPSLKILDIKHFIYERYFDSNTPDYFDRNYTENLVYWLVTIRNLPSVEKLSVNLFLGKSNDVYNLPIHGCSICVFLMNINTKIKYIYLNSGVDSYDPANMHPPGFIDTVEIYEISTDGFFESSEKISNCNIEYCNIVAKTIDPVLLDLLQSRNTYKVEKKGYGLVQHSI